MAVLAVAAHTITLRLAATARIIVALPVVHSIVALPTVAVPLVEALLVEEALTAAGHVVAAQAPVAVGEDRI